MSATLSVLVCLASGLAHQPPPHSVSPLLSQGQESRVTFYSVGLLEHVARKRNIVLPAGYAGFVSRPDCSRLGSTVWLKIGKGAVKRYRQVDCAEPVDRKRQEAVNLTEVSYQTAVDAGFKDQGHTRGTIWEAK